jgi:hypothetical protein
MARKDLDMDLKRLLVEDVMTIDPIVVDVDDGAHPVGVLSSTDFVAHHLEA